MAISEMEFKEDDSPTDIQYKLKMLEIYNTRLDEVRLARVWSRVCVRVGGWARMKRGGWDGSSIGQDIGRTSVSYTPHPALTRPHHPHRPAHQPQTPNPPNPQTHP